MAGYTREDEYAAEQFAYTNVQIRLLHELFNRAPHIITHATWHIEDGVSYYVPETLKPFAKTIHIAMTEPLCEAVSCMPMKERDPCNPNEPASYYYVGDSAYDVQCQPSCYHLAEKPNFAANGARQVEAPYVRWNARQSKCRYLNTSTVVWLEKPFYRSDARYELRVNDMPTGFSRIDDPDHPYGSGITYRGNPSYCRYYDLDYVAATTGCKLTSFWGIVGEAIVGQSVINLIRSTVRTLSNAPLLQMPVNLPARPTQLKPEHTLEQWRKNINRDFEPPAVIDPFGPPPAQSSRLRRSASGELPSRGHNWQEHHRRRELAERKLREADADGALLTSLARRQMGLPPRGTPSDGVDGDRSGSGSAATDDGADPDSGAAPRRARRNVAGLDSELGPTTAATATADRDGGADTTPLVYKLAQLPEEIKAFILGLPQHAQSMALGLLDMARSILESFGDPNTWKMIGVNLVYDALAAQVKKLGVGMVERLTGLLAKESMRIGGRVGERTLAAAVRSVSRFIAVRIGAQMVVRGAILLARLLVAATSVVGWLLLGSMLLDLLLSFFDPFGYNNMLPPELPGDFMEAGERSLRQELEVAQPNFEFMDLANRILGPDVILGVMISSLIDRLVYLEHLVVNSEGSRIDKGPEIPLVDLPVDSVAYLQNAGLSQRVRFDAASFAEDGWTFGQRVRLNQYLNRAALALGGVTVTLLVLQLWLFALMLIFLLVAVLVTAHLSLQADPLVETLSRYTNRSTDAAYTTFVGERGYVPG